MELVYDKRINPKVRAHARSLVDLCLLVDIICQCDMEPTRHVIDKPPNHALYVERHHLTMFLYCIDSNTVQ